MKKLLLTLSSLFSYLAYSQAIDVNTTTYTVPQLVNSVLINSTCVSANNITWSTGTNFGSSNGIGFFENTNPNFPLQSGVILSTGNILNAAGPNTTELSDGSSTWPGNVSLENTLAAAGIPMVSKNATVLEFGFTPISSYFSFDFVFASEEYGNFQCQFSDAFAFLLTNLNTGVTTNLAVVPNTNIPISVVTIRDYNYNSSCPSANQQFFGRFNGGYNANNAAINFNGQTKSLTASSILTPNVPYSIKLVIADRLDAQSDSAIFISANSFNIGQNALGPDLTIANSTAKCPNTTHLLDTGLSATEYSFTWKRNGVLIPGQTSPSLTITQAGTYVATFTNLVTGCDPYSDEIKVEYYPVITSPNPINLYRCETGDTTFTYNLNLNTARVKQGLNAATTVSYFLFQNEAENNVNQLPLSYTSQSGVTIYVRIQVPNNPCPLIKSFQLLTSPPPTANQAPNLTKCAANQNQQSFFNLTHQTTTILNGQSTSINSVSYHTSLSQANSGTNAITNPNSYFSISRTIYARVQNTTDVNCFNISSFELIVLPIPVVDLLQNVLVCTSFTLLPLTNGNYFTSSNGNGTPLFAGDVITQTQTIFIFNQPNGPGTCGANSSFIVTIINAQSLTPQNVFTCGSYTLPPLTFGKYYTGPSASGSEILPGTVISSTQQIYYYFITTTSPICSVDSSFIVTIIPSVELGDRPDVFECNSYTLPALAIGSYYTGPNGTGNIIQAGTEFTSNQTIYVYVNLGTSPSCRDQDVFNIFIGIAEPANITQCNGYTLPVLPVGNYYTGPSGTGTLIPSGTLINESSTIYIYAQNSTGTNNCTDDLYFTITLGQPQIDLIANTTVCGSYTLPQLTYGQYYTGAAGTGTLLQPGHVFNTTQTLYVFRRLNSTCYNENSFTITVNQYPAIDSRSDIDICNQYQLTELSVGKYYTGINGTGVELPANTIITTSQLIYIYASTNTTPNCISQTSFQINIFSTTADSSSNITACDSYTLPTLSSNNRYFTNTGGPNGTGTEILAGTTITTSQTIYIYKIAVIRTDFSCFDETSFTVTINNTPAIPVLPNVNTCNSYTLEPLTIGNYYTGTNGTGTLLHAGHVITETQTLYVYALTNTTPSCISERSFLITIYNVDELPNVTICEGFTLPALNNGRYYTGPNATGTILPSGTVISTTQTLYIFGTSTFLPRCNDESSFTVTIIDTPVVNTVPVLLRTICDEDGVNDGVTTFNLNNLVPAILGSQTGSSLEVSFYNSMADAQNATNAVTTSNQTIVYVKVKNILTANCYDIQAVNLIINKLPIPKPQDGIICINSQTGMLLKPYTIYSNLSASNHTFIWKNDSGTTVGTGSSYLAILPGVYTLIATNSTTGCASEEINVNVIPSEPAVVSYVVSENFGNDQYITVTAVGQGNNFEYQLNDGPFQDSNVFYNVNSGTHTITVRDKNGCDSTTINALVINYPKYFTPNDDGYNDTWNIIDLSSQSNASIIIYDRYGKALKEIKPSRSGWDGTYNGRMMPSDDYWFSVTFVDDKNESKEFKSHFAMKR